MNHRLRTSLAARLLSLALIVVIAGLAGATALRVKAHSAQEPARTVYYIHGRIYTNDPPHPWAQGMAVRDGKIICVGALSHVLLECGGGAAHAETVGRREKFARTRFSYHH